ncbi:MAG: SUMF1/EgtB/PvdO family nonheme iron enzyme [Anaerolineae bacterium]|nr:SUMF1/EgtB/PvdO family nonheme iron enzyme [Anaerolineae bacterium]
MDTNGHTSARVGHRPTKPRGGSFNNQADNARCANRNRNQPDNRNNNIGFRVAQSLDSGKQKCSVSL